MNIESDAMLVSLRIRAWSGHRHDRGVSDRVAAEHEASSGAGRYNKRLLPKDAFAALTATISEARKTHFAHTLPWDDQGNRLLTVANYDTYTGLMDRLGEQLVRERGRFLADFEHNIVRAQLELGKLFRAEDYPPQEVLRDRFSLRYRILPAPDAEHFMAKLAAQDTDRVKRDIERQIGKRLEDALADLYRRLGEAVGHVSQRLREDESGKPLVFRNSLIENVRAVVDVAPKLNLFGDEHLARLCEEVKDKIAGVEPDALRPSRAFDPKVRARVKHDADDLLERFSGYFGDAGGAGGNGTGDVPPVAPGPRAGVRDDRQGGAGATGGLASEPAGSATDRTPIGTQREAA